MKTKSAAAIIAVFLLVGKSYGQYKDLELGERWKSIGFYATGGINSPVLLSKSLKTGSVISPGAGAGFIFGNKMMSLLKVNFLNKSHYRFTYEELPEGENFYSSTIRYTEIEGALKGCIIGNLNKKFSLFIGAHGSLSLKAKESDIHSTIRGAVYDTEYSEGMTRVGFSFTGNYKLNNRFYGSLEAGLHSGILDSGHISSDRQPLAGILLINSSFIYIISFGKGD